MLRCRAMPAFATARRGRVRANGAALAMRHFKQIPPADELPLKTYQELIDTTLDKVQEALDNMDTAHPELGVDSDHAEGVLSFALGEHSFVLNKQAPNMQLWLSSPVRGPLRYEFRMDSAAWVNNRDAHPLLPSIAEDVALLTGHTVDFCGVEEELRQVVARLDSDAQ